MTDEQLCAAVAVKVLGWKICDREKIGWGPGPTVWWTNEEDSPTMQEPFILTWEGIGLIVEAMRERGYYFDLSTPSSGDCLARFGKVPIGYNYAEAPDAPHAVALAALKALEAA